MNKTQLNKEQIEYIRSHYFNSGYVETFTEDDIYWYLSESESIAELNEGYFARSIGIVNLGGRFFGYHTGKDLPDNKQPSPIIKEYESKEVKTMIYKPI